VADWDNYVEIPSVRKLFVVPIAENNHGKSLVIRALLRLAGTPTTGWKRLDVALMTFSGQRISALIFPSSLPEMKSREPQKKTAEEFLQALDRQWWTYDLILLPIHEDPAVADELIALGQRHGFDMIAVTITRDEVTMDPAHQDCLCRPWNERWILRNPTLPKFQIERKKLGALSKRAEAQINALAGLLWTRIQRTMFP
jgi:hypothetical protein